MSENQVMNKTLVKGLWELFDNNPDLKSISAEIMSDDKYKGQIFVHVEHKQSKNE